MAQYIDRESAMLLPELPKEYRNYQTDNLDDAYEQGWYDALCCLEHIPAADVAPVRHGDWEIVLGSNGNEYMVCTCCRVSQDLTGVFTYCPNCGARMDKEAPNGSDAD